jgi:hypothetical protein
MEGNTMDPESFWWKEHKEVEEGNLRAAENERKLRNIRLAGPSKDKDT